MIYGLIGALLLGIPAYFAFGESVLAGGVVAFFGYGAGECAERCCIGKATLEEVNQNYREYAA
ncbi:MAG: hypothetical protein U9Q92_02215 [archaeon]|nr:hypothetical protein [archaeon]